LAVCFPALSVSRARSWSRTQNGCLAILDLTYQRVDREQGVESLPLSLRQTVRQSLERSLAGAQAGCQSDSLQHRRSGDEHIGGAQMGEHCPHDRLTAVRDPCVSVPHAVSCDYGPPGRIGAAVNRS
jgi:hypothetical protein